MKKVILIFLFFAGIITEQPVIGQYNPFSFLNKTANTFVYNDIGIAGQKGFGAGVCNPANLPSELVEMTGTRDAASNNYGNYMCVVDSSIMVYVPKFYYSIVTFATDSNYIRVSTTLQAGYVVHRAFIDGGVEKDGFFVDKYKWCLTNDTWSGATQLTGIASSRRFSNPIASGEITKRTNSNGTAGLFSNCISNGQSPADYYGGGFAVAKSRGNNFFLMNAFQGSALAMLSLVQAINSTDTSVTKWYNATNNFPKGNNNSGADVNDASVTYTACTDEYWKARNEARMNGGANRLDKTTHNGQMSGVADLNGNQWEIVGAYTYVGSVRWLYKSSVVQKNVTYTNITTAAWISANMDTTVVNFPANTRFGNGTNAVLSGAVSGDGYENTSLGFPYWTWSVSAGGTNKFGQDYSYGGTGNCLIRSGGWGNGTGAGVWCANVSTGWTIAYRIVSGRSCLYTN